MVIRQHRFILWWRTRGWLVRIGTWLRLVAFACYFLASVSTNKAESLIIEPEKRVYYLFEPIVLDVTLTVEQGIQSALEGSTRITPRDRFRRRLKAFVDGGNGTLAEAFLGGGAFNYEPATPHVSRATVMGCLGNKTPGNSESTRFLFWGIPGEYRVYVIDVDSGIRSDFATIRLVEPPDMEAATLFASPGAATISLLLGGERGAEAVHAFEILQMNHSETVYGAYASAVLAVLELGQFSAESHSRGNNLEAAAAIAALERTSMLLPPGNPLWNRAMLALAGFVGQQDSDLVDLPRMKIMKSSLDSSYIEAARSGLTNVIGQEE